MQVVIGIDAYELRQAGRFFTIAKPGGTAYLVGSQPGYCECPDFKYRGQLRPCKHVNALREHLMQTQEKEQVADAEFTAAEIPTGNLPAVIEKPAVLAPRGQLAAALIEARRQCRAVEKDSTNTFHKYKYASSEAIIEEAKAALDSSGIAVIPVELSVNGHTKEGEDRFELSRKFLLEHVSGEQRLCACNWPICPEKGRPLDKATAIADTLSLAYFLRDLLMMPRVDPSDDLAGRNDTGKPEKPAANGAARAAKPEPKPQPEPEKPAEEPPAPPEPCLSATDLARLKELVQEHQVNVGKMQAHFKVKQLSELKSSQYERAVRYIVGGLPSTAEQQQRIRELIDSLKISAKVVKEKLHDYYRADSLSGLSRLQADDMVARLVASQKVAAAKTPSAAALAS